MSCLETMRTMSGQRMSSDVGFLAQTATMVGGGIAAAGWMVGTSEEAMAQAPVSVSGANEAGAAS